MSLIQDAITRANARPEPKRIDYSRMNAILPRQKAALTRAKKTGNAEKIALVCKQAVTEWNDIGAWPDNWNVWQIALNDALPWNRHVDINDL